MELIWMYSHLSTYHIRLKNGDVIRQPLKRIEVHVEGNGKKMNNGIKEGENDWQMVIFQQVDIKVELRDLGILNLLFMYFMI